MNDKRASLSSMFMSIVLFLTVFMLGFFCFAYNSNQAKIDDISQELETSRQREVKQQYEYDEAVRALPFYAFEAGILHPRAEAHKQTVSTLKEKRKLLRNALKNISDKNNETIKQGEDK